MIRVPGLLTMTVAIAVAASAGPASAPREAAAAGTVGASTRSPGANVAPPAGADRAAERRGRAEKEIRELFAAYLRLHAAKDMEAWRQLFLPEVVCVRTGSDGVVSKYPIAELAAGIAEDAKDLEEQHETFEDVRLEAHGDAASYSTTYSLFHDHRKIQQGRAFFSLVRVGGAWKIASLVWYRE